MSDDIAYLSLLDVSERIRTQALTAEHVTRTLLDRIARYDGRLNSFLLVTAESALEAAYQADREIRSGLYRGALHGVPIGLKDLISTKGIATTAGMAIYKDFRPEHDATVVTRLRRAGAVILGKLHTTEGATMHHHQVFSRPDNPWRAGHWTGISSSGSGVSVAAGFCYAALGTDTGGSIRLPSASCGLSGVKPTWGRVSRHGLFPLAPSFDHLGPMARTAADAAAVLRVIAGADPEDPTTLRDPVPNYLAMINDGISGLRIGVDWGFATDRVAPAVAQGINDAAAMFAALGATIVPISLPPSPTLSTEISPLLQSEVALAHAATYPARAAEYGRSLAGMIDAAAAFTGQDVARAVQARAAFSGRLAGIFQSVDLLLLPSMPTTAPLWADLAPLGDDAMSMMDLVGRYTLMFNATGNPTLSMPSGFDEQGLPTSLQLVGPLGGEPLLFRAGHAFQQVTAFHTRHPDLSASAGP